MNGQYILIDKIPIKEPDLFKWGEYMSKSERRVAVDTIYGFRVSTVFLGLDHSFSINKLNVPVLFETMIFDDRYTESGWDAITIHPSLNYQERYATWGQAEKGHQKAIEYVKKNIIKLKYQSYINQIKSLWNRLKRKLNSIKLNS